MEGKIKLGKPVIETLWHLPGSTVWHEIESIVDFSVPLVTRTLDTPIRIPVVNGSWSSVWSSILNETD